MSASSVRARLGGFTLNVAISSLAGLIAIALIIRGAGPSAWAAVAVGQAVGGIAALLVSLGWGVAGPARVASLPPSERPSCFAQALGTRIVVLALVLPLSLVVGCAAVPDHRWTAGLVAAASSTFGLNASWYFTGVGTPMTLLRCETVPRATTSLAGAVGVLLGGSVLLVPLATIVGSCAATAAGWTSVARTGPVVLPSLRSNLTGIKDGLTSLSVTSSITVYSALPLVFAAVLAPDGLAPFALLDRFKNFALTAMGPAVQVAQGYTAGGTRHGLVRRTERTFVLGVVIGVVAAAAFPVAVVVGSQVMSHGTIEVPLSLTLMFSVVVGIGVVSSMIGMACLPARGEIGGVSRSTATGAFVFLSLVLPLGARHDATGVALAAVLAEVCVVILLIRYFLRGRVVNA